MSNHLLQSVSSLFNNEIVQKMTSAFGESEGGIQKALSGAIPTILAGFVAKSNQSNGSQELFNLSQDAANAGISSNISALFNGGGNILDKGVDMVRKLFGTQTENIITSISNFAGIRHSSASSLLGMVAPASLGVLGNEIKKNNLSPGGLSSWLNQQKESILSALPGNLSLSSIPGLAAITGLTGNQSGHHIQTNLNKRPVKGGPRWIVPVIIILLILALLLYFMKGCKGDAPQVIEEIKDTTTVMVDKATDKIKEMVKLDLNANLKIDAYKGGIEEQLITYLRDKDAAIDKNRWFDFDDLNFETGSAIITESSMRQVKNIANILEAFPNAKIKIGGYTDKTGDDAINKKLSQERAEAVHNALLSQGVKKEQLAGAEGYGSEFAKAPADAPESERAKDRHISINVREK